MPDRPPFEGWRRTGQVRVRSGWFGIAVIEEQLEQHDGSVKWERVPSWREPIVIDEFRVTTW